jgi:thiol-disulfide isomerase/thioredoxin
MVCTARTQAISSRSLAVVLPFFLLAAVAVLPGSSQNRISIDLGWISATQQQRGWLVTSALQPNGKIQVGDVLLRIDGQVLSAFGPLAVARMLQDVPFRRVPVVVSRGGETHELQVFREGVVTDGTVKVAPSYLVNELQKRDAPAPPFSVSDLRGQQQSPGMYLGKWVLLTFWGTWCGGCLEEIPALNYLNEKHSTEIVVLSVDINDSPEELRKFLRKHLVSYPVVLGGSFDDSIARSYSVHSAPANVIIAPDGNIAFVGYSYRSLKRAVESIGRGWRDEASRP